MRNTLKQNEEHSQIKKKKKKKNCSKASPQKSPTSILNVKQTQSKQKNNPKPTQ